MSEGGSTLSTPQLLRVLGHTLPFLWRSAPGLVSLLALVQVLSGLTPALAVLLGKWTVDGLTHLAQGRSTNLTLLVLAWTATAALSQMTAMAATVLQGYITDHFTLATVTSVIDKMATLPGLDVLDDPRFHDDIDLIQEGARYRPLNLLATVSQMLEGLVSTSGLALTLLILGWWVPLLVVAGLLPLTLNRMRVYQAGWGFAIQRSQEARELAYDQRVAVRSEYAAEVRLYGLLPWLRGRYVDRATRYQNEMRTMRNGIVLTALPGQALALSVSASVFALAVWEAGRGQVTAGTVVLAVAALSQLQNALIGVTELLGTGTQHLNWFEKYHSFLAAVPGVAIPKHPRPVPDRLDLNLEHVTFRYPDGRVAIDDLSLHLPYGQTLAVVGENGAGKSTLAKLLLRFYDPQEGRVLVGQAETQTDLRDLDPAAWRAEVAAVFQDFARFDYTLRENVLLGRVEQQASLDAAVQGSGLAAVLPRLPQGLDTRLGTSFGGTDLSGGQWQKLATARALYRDAPLLILDEPTAALDPRSEREVFDSFVQLARSGGRPRTTVLITHRLGSVTLADRIVVLKAGRIIEQGTHHELLDLGGEYAELWRLQAQQYSSDTDSGSSVIHCDSAYAGNRA